MMQMEEDLLEALSQCITLRNTEDEYAFLTEFVATLQQAEDDIDYVELGGTDQYFIKEVVQRNPAPNCTLEVLRLCGHKASVLWTVNEELDWFLFYVFHRRYGWPDLEEDKSCLIISRPEARGKLRRSSKIEELKFKARLLHSLDIIIMWLFHQPVSLLALRMFSSAFHLAVSSPVTRLQLSIHALDWTKERLTEPDDPLFDTLKTLLVLIVTDVWSQIRSAGVSRLGPIVDKLSLSQTQCLFEELAQLCEPSDSTWQVTDGAISALNAIIKRFQRVGYDVGVHSGATSSSISPRVHCQIRLGRHVLDRFPSYIPYTMKSLVFQLVSNPQLTIRETVIKAFVNCLNRCSEHESSTAFDDVFQRLKFRNLNHQGDADMDHLSQISTFAFMDPYTAESLLHLMVFLFKRKPDHQSYLENWDIHYQTFDLYLMHPASSVRLSTSNFYKFVVALGISHPLLVKNIMHCLVRNWTPDQTILLRPLSSLAAVEDRRRLVSITDPNREVLTESDLWEWREGRLLVYELVCQLLIKNHSLYTFGPPNISGERHRRKGSLGVLDTDSGVNSARDTLLVTQSWNRTSSVAANGQVANNVVLRKNSQLSSSDPALHTHDTSDNTEMKNRRKSYAVFPVQDRQKSKPPVPPPPPPPPPSVPHFTDLRRLSHCMRLESGVKHKCSSFLDHVKEVETSLEDAVTRNQIPADSLLPPFRSILSIMFHTCTESLADPQWELRRIAKQTFPCLGELLRWFEPDMLAGLITTHLVCEPTLMTYACLLLLRDTLRHTVRLRIMTANPPDSWQGGAITAVESIINTVRDNLLLWLRSCQYYLQRDRFDCITVITTHVVVLALTHFVTSPTEYESYLKSLLCMLEKLDSVLQGSNDTGVEIMGHDIYQSSNDGGRPPSTGSIPPGTELCSHLVDQLREDLPALVQRSGSQSVSTARLLPLLAGWIRPLVHLRTDTSECLRILVHCLGILSCSLIDWSKRDGSVLVHIETDVKCTVDVVCTLLTDRTVLETWWMRQLLDILVQLISMVPTDLDCLIRTLLPALAARLPNGNTSRRLSSTVLENQGGSNKMTLNSSGGVGKKSNSGTNLQLFSSQAHAESLDDSDPSLVDSDEDELAISYPESLALTRSRHGSSAEPGQLPGNSRNEMSEEPLSDWDSDSDTDEPDKEDAAEQIALACLSKLSRCRPDLFKTARSCLSPDELSILQAVNLNVL